MLCDLPNEVIGLIVGLCPPSDLCALSRTCKPLRSHAVPTLYRTITFGKGYGEYALRALESRRAELLKLTRSLDVTLRWSAQDRLKTKRAVQTVNRMVNLRHLSIMYDEEEQPYLGGHELPMPLMIARTLTNCTIGFKGWACWPIEDAICLFEHPTLRQLKLHWACSTMNDPIADRGKRSTKLTNLALIDCDIEPVDLYRVLRYPCALEYLTLATDFFDNYIHDDEEFNCSDFFSAIERTSGSLKGLRFDVAHWGNIIVPAPGMHKLRNVRYLEVAPDHIEIANEVLSWGFPIPDIECPLEQLLPPNVEVLKVTPLASDMPTLWRIVERKRDIVPHLRKIILTLLYRNRAMKKELIISLLKDRTKGNVEFENEDDLQSAYPCVRKRILPSFRKYCHEHGVELVFLHEDPFRKEILEEDAGPAVWEIEEQVK
ncbi:hypothetical protein V8E51_002732 [Hyaloscypha variabilis]